MATSYKILAQSSPVATTETSTIASSIMVCNRGTSSATFRISVSASGAATANKDYIYYNVPIGTGDTFVATVGITLGNTDVVRVYATTADLSFNLFGSEIS
jgi:hypothetical protein